MARVWRRPVNRPPKLARHLFLVGFMGVGKTRLGRLVSRRLDSHFYDLDHQVEDGAGLRVAQIFERFGQTYFRELEHVALRRMAGLEAAVVATGGGAFTFERNRQIIKNLGISLWIDLDFDSIVERMSSRGRAARPLLQDEHRARALFEARRDFYSQADLVVEVESGEAAKSVAARIMGLLQERRLLRERPCVTS